MHAGPVAAQVDQAAIPRGPGSEHIPALDGLRGVAILMVMLFHFGGEIEDQGRYCFLCRPLRLGWTGVDLFFVLSGFLITGILLGAKHGPHYFRNFYARRTLRVFPLYFLVLGLVALGSSLSTGISHWVGLGLHQQWWYWSYLSNVLVAVKGDWVGPFDHFWSLAVEEHFYLIWPLVVLLLSPRWLMVGCLTLMALAMAARFIATSNGHATVAAYVLTPCRMDSLACGAAMAVIMRMAACMRWVVRWAWLLLFPLLAGVTAVGCAAHGYNDMLLPVQRYGLTLMALAFALVVGLAASAGNGRTSPLILILRQPTLRFLGRYSYAMYVFHPLLENFRRWIFRNWPLRSNLAFFGCYTTVALATAIIPAILSWHLFESPILSLKRFFPYETVRSKSIAAGSLRPRQPLSL